MKKKLTAVQICTLIVFTLYLVWEYNMQEFISVNGLSNSFETRLDLLLLVPLLLVLVSISIWQFVKK
ncbi:hypothetical protein [Dokdonia sp. MED134]|uniref:hypothetical protein n=1 Tax=Dokdonia sp. MED134 TaxID=313590 RepID=UPI0000689F6C|nr:hypothetical protein [Dokdonia sp. MED134]